MSSLLVCTACLTAGACWPVATHAESVQAELIARHTAAVPGRTLQVAVRLEMAPGWHTYWRNPGDSGMATSLEWDLPDGFAIGPIVWPAPEYFEVGGLASYGYEDEVLLPVGIGVPRGFSGESVTLLARADWLVCKETCIPGGADLSLTVPVTADRTAVRENEQHVERFTRSDRRTQPVLVADESSGRVVLEPAGYRLTLGSTFTPTFVADGAVARFFPFDAMLIAMSSPQVTTLDAVGGLSLTAPPHPLASGPAERFAGVVVWSDPSGASPDEIFEIDLPIRGVADGE
ncbi:MAG: protein-disulfide reductase DsbD domain-containing protein [Planctomycetota bacterium]